MCTRAGSRKASVFPVPVYPQQQMGRGEGGGEREGNRSEVDTRQSHTHHESGMITRGSLVQFQPCRSLGGEWAMTDTAGDRERERKERREVENQDWMEKRKKNLNWSWFLETSLGDLIQDVSYGTQYNKSPMYAIQDTSIKTQ